MAKSKITIHPLGPITVAGIAVLTWFLVKELGLFKGALPDMDLVKALETPTLHNGVLLLMKVQYQEHLYFLTMVMPHMSTYQKTL